jgi:hypothetical protein
MWEQLGWLLIGGEILCIFVSSRAILNPTSLWQFFLSMLTMTIGYRLFATGQLRL